MAKQNDLSRSLIAFEQNNTLIAVIEMSLNSWLVAGIVPAVERQPLKKMSVDEEVLLRLLYRWRDEAAKAGRKITRMAVAFEAGRDGFWLARWLRGRGIETYVMHPTSVAPDRRTAICRYRWSRSRSLRIFRRPALERAARRRAAAEGATAIASARSALPLVPASS